MTDSAPITEEAKRSTDAILATLDRAYGAMARAFDRIHQLPRVTDSNTARELQVARRQIEEVRPLAASLLADRERLEGLADKYKWQVRETCVRAEAAEARATRLGAENKRLREVAVDVLTSLVAAQDLLSRGGKKAAPSDKMFSQMLSDYDASIERGRAALQEGPTHNKGVLS